jgi:alkaline phosphatase/alkaline phosphatase D
MKKLIGFTFGGFLILTGCSSVPKAGQGIMVGGVTSASVLAQVRLTKTDRLVRAKVVGPAGFARDVPGMAGVVEFSLLAAGGSDVLETQLIEAKTENDFIARAAFKELKAGARYEIRTRIGASGDDLQEGPRASFRSLPGKNKAESVQFVVVTGMNYGKFHGDERIDRATHLAHNNTELPRPYAGTDKHLGYPALASILKLRPDFLVGTGDNVYYDTPKEPRAQSIAELRQKWHEQFVQPRYRDLFAVVPTYWEIDDHDYRIDDGDNSGDHEPSVALAQRMMREQLPYAPMGDTTTKTYRTHRVSKDLQIWFVENRMYRSDNNSTDGPNKTVWGAEQKAWLKGTLAASDATFKIMISPNPMVGPDDARKFDNHTNFGGFRHERDEFFKWLQDSGVAQKGFYVMCGDRHWQYHSIHPTGIEEFSCGALVDANSRLGRKPGDPESTDPKGLIKQVYAQKERSAGFMQVQVDPAKGGASAKLTVTWHDEHGKVLHTTTK